jgi:hypothetical protein
MVVLWVILGSAFDATFVLVSVWSRLALPVALAVGQNAAPATPLEALDSRILSSANLMSRFDFIARSINDVRLASLNPVHHSSSIVSGDATFFVPAHPAGAFASCDL